MANPNPPKLVLTSEIVILKVGKDTYDVVERSVEGRVTEQKRHESKVSLPVARERWEILKRARAPSKEGWR